MESPLDVPIETWADRLKAAIVGSRWFDRVRVLRETASTQDTARAAAGGRPGLVVTAGRQTAGRGRLGRAWEQRADLGMAVTFVVGKAESRVLSMVGGLAALDACRACGVASAGLKAPNDVVVLDATVVSGYRKIAGVLVEQGDGLALVGIGVNVAQTYEDFGTSLRHSATSLRLLGSGAVRIDVLLALTRAMDRRLGNASEELERAWEEAIIVRPDAAGTDAPNRRGAGGS